MERRLKRIYRKRSPAQLVEDERVRALIEKEKPELIALGRRVFTRAARLRDALAKLKAARESQGLSLQEVGERTGIGKANLSRLENELNPNPKIDTLAHYAEALGQELVISLAQRK